MSSFFSHAVGVACWRWEEWLAVPDDLRAAIEKNPRARKMPRTLGRMNLFALTFRVNNLKTPAGRAKKIVTLVEMLARGETIVPEGPRK